MSLFNRGMNRALYDEVAALPGERDSLFGYCVDRDWQLWRTYNATSTDGRVAKVWVLRAPAQFFRLTAGDVEITTGSGTAVGELLLALAQAISNGMLTVRLGGGRARP